MKYKLIIDKEKEEEICVTVHAPSALTKQIEDLVYAYTGTEFVIGYRADEIRKIPFNEIECITIVNRRVIAVDADKNEYTLKERLRDLELMLPSYFIRINKSALANEHRIQRFHGAFNGAIFIIIKR